MAFDPINIGVPLTPKQQDFAARVNVGFRFDDKGTHTSRTIMLEELQVLMRACPPESPASVIP